MTSEPHPEEPLIERWRAGDQEAARLLVDCWMDRLLAVVRRHLSRRLAARFDPEDVVQSAFRTFFRRVRAGQFRLEHREDVLRLLIRITILKTLKKVRHHLAEKRSPKREAGPDEEQRRLQEVLSREPSPETASLFLDQLEHFLRRLRPVERHILRWRMEGYRVEEIARKLGTYDRRVSRFLEHIRALAEREALFSPDEPRAADSS